MNFIMVDITLLGTSALFPLPERALTSVFLFCEGHSILFDCGEGTQTAARKSDVSLMKTDIIAITHYHGDHILGLPGLLQTMSSLKRTEPLYIMGPENISEELAPILKLTGFTTFEIILMEISEELRLCELIKGWPYEAILTPFPTVHRIKSQGYVFKLGRAGKFLPEKAKALNIPVTQWSVLQKGQSINLDDKIIMPDQVLGEPRKGLKFVFSGDTAMCETLTSEAKEADLLICEATYGENEQAELATEHGHMNFAQAAETAKRADVKNLWLAHYSPRIERPSYYLQHAKDIFPKTFCGYDGMRMTLNFED